MIQNTQTHGAETWDIQAAERSLLKMGIWIAEDQLKEDYKRSIMEKAGKNLVDNYI